MNDIKFFKSFSYNVFKYKQYRTTDMTNGCPVHYLAQIVNGSAKIISDGQTLTLKKGDIFYIPKNLSYRSYWYPENDCVCFYSFGFEFFPTHNGNFKLQKIELTNGENALFDVLKNDITVCPQTIGRLYYLLGEIAPRLSFNEHTTSTTINTALAFMQQNTDCTIKQVAKFCNVSEAGLYNKFKKHIGKTPVTIKQEILCKKAKELLSSTDLPIEEISDKLGFSSSSYFRKIFYSKTHKTPTAYRKKSRSI